MMSDSYDAVLTTFNSETTVSQAFESIFSQTVPPSKIIVVDDCSSDKTVEIIESYATKKDNIIFIRQSVNQGQSYARNVAADTSNSKYLIYLY